MQKYIKNIKIYINLNTIPGVGFEPTSSLRLDLKSSALTTRPTWYRVFVVFG